MREYRPIHNPSVEQRSAAIQSMLAEREAQRRDNLRSEYEGQLREHADRRAILSAALADTARHCPVGLRAAIFELLEEESSQTGAFIVQRKGPNITLRRTE